VAKEVLAVKGYRELLRATDRSGKASKKEVRTALADAGEIVRADGQRLFTKYDARSAAGFTVSVRATGVSIRQRLRKTTGQHPEYGALQMRTLLKARAENTENVEKAFEKAIDRIADTFDEH
jgi:hypothetical protein